MKYDAFISYRHADLDTYIAKKVHKKLETFRVPHSVQKKTGKKKIQRVFRDQDELPIGSDLGDNIQLALSESEYLIVICSPRTPGSEWVQKEIQSFIQLHDRNHVLAVLIEGEPNESFPAALLTDEQGRPVEPLAADVRGKSKGEVKRKLKSELMRLAAPLLNCSYDDLRQRHKERKMRRVFSITTAIVSVVAVLGIAFGAYSTYQKAQIQSNYNDKLMNQSKYLADTALSVYENGDPRTAALIAREALPTDDNDRPFLTRAQYALTYALNAYSNGSKLVPVGALNHDSTVLNATMDAEATHIVSYDNFQNVYLWDANTFDKLAQIDFEYNDYGNVSFINLAVFINEKIIVARDNNAAAYDEEGKLLWEFDSKAQYETYNGAIISTDGKHLILQTLSNVYVIDTETGKAESSYSVDDAQYFTSQLAISDDGSYLAVAHSGGTDVSVMDLTTHSQWHIATPYQYIARLKFADSQLVILGNNEPAESVSDGSYAVSAYDFMTSALTWTTPLDVAKDPISTTDTTICYKNNKLCIVLYSSVVELDAATGANEHQFTTHSDVKSVLTPVNGDKLVLGEESGKIEFFDLMSHDVSSSDNIDAGMSIRNIKISNGTFVIIPSYDSRILVRRYDTNENADLGDVFNHVSSVYSSPSEKNYCIYDNQDLTISFYRTKDDTLLYTHAVDYLKYEYGDINHMGFLSDDVFCYTLRDGKAKYIYFKDGDEDLVDLISENNSSFSVYTSSKNGKYYACYSSNTVYVVDLEAQKVLYEISDADKVNTLALSNDGKHCACATSSSITLFNNEGKETTEYSDIPVAVNSINTAEPICFSDSGAYLSVICIDNKLRIIDTDSCKCAYTIEFQGASYGHVCFSPDDSKVLIYNDQYRYSIYDLKEETTIFTSSSEIFEVNRIEWFEDGQIVLYTPINYEGLYLLGDDYELLAYVPQGACYLKEFQKLISVNNSFSDEQVYIFPVYTLSELLDLLEEKYPGVQLSETDKLTYNID